MIKTGDSVLIHNPFDWRRPITYLSKIIRLLTGAFYNHAALLVEVSGKFYVVEAIFPRVAITEFEKWKAKDKSRIFKIVEIESAFTEVELTHRIIEQVGKKYDTASLLNILYYLIKNKWYGRTGTSAAKKLYCFELVAYVHNEEKYWMVIPSV